MRLDIIIPAHNEERRIDTTLTAYRSVCSSPDVRFLVAMDDCSDRTPEIVGQHAREDSRVRPLRFPKLGKGGVIMESFRRSDAEALAFVDADCATPPSELLRLLAVVRDQGVDGAIATRWHPAAVLPGRRRRRPMRRAASAAFALSVRRLFRLPYSDTQCGAKVVRRPVVDRVVPLLSSRDFLFDVDLLVTARALGFTLVEVPTVWVDRDGSRIDLARDSKRMAASLLRLWIHHRVLPAAAPAAAYPDAPTHVPAPAATVGAEEDAHAF